MSEANNGNFKRKKENQAPGFSHEFFSERLHLIFGDKPRKEILQGKSIHCFRTMRPVIFASADAFVTASSVRYQSARFPVSTQRRGGLELTVEGRHPTALAGGLSCPRALIPGTRRPICLST